MNEQIISVSLRRLSVFLAVCETLHLARAAEKLGVAQPALSQQIRSLEEALGVSLFYRRKRGIDLTEAGHACRVEAQQLLENHNLLIDKVRRVARGEVGQLAIGHVSSALAGKVFPNHLRHMQHSFPEMQLLLHEKSISGLVAAILAKDLDVAIVRDLETVPKTCTTRRYLTEKLFIILPETHFLAVRHILSLTDIRDEPLIGFQDPDQVGITQIVQKIARKNGNSIHIAWTASNTGGILGMVLGGLGIAIVAESVTELLPKGLVARVLDDPEAVSNLWIIWNTEQVSPALQHFLDLQQVPVATRTPFSKASDVR